MQEYQIEYWPLEKLIPYARNPRKNDQAVEQVAAAIREFGFRVPVVAKSDGTIIDGHLRLKAAKALKMEKVPVICGDDMTEAQVKAFRISVNRMAELAEWDFDMLKLELEELKGMDFDLELTGLDGDMVTDLLNTIEGTEGETDPDDVPDAPAEPITRPGDLYILGRHRLLCGDSTKITDVERLMDGKKADMVFTDPPYGMNLNTDFTGMGYKNGAEKQKVKGAVSKKYRKVIGDDSKYDPSHIFRDFGYVDEIFLWGADYYAELIPDRDKGSWIVWDKRAGLEDVYWETSEFELCWMKQKHHRRIARFQWMGACGTQMEEAEEKKGKGSISRVHPNQKPVRMYKWFLEKWGGS